MRHNHENQPSQSSRTTTQHSHYIDIQQVGFDNLLFWSYFLCTSYPCAYLESKDCRLCDLVEDTMPIDPVWSDDFTQYYDGIGEESDGYVDNPTTITSPISSTETLKIEFHPGDTIFYINHDEIGCTGPHWKLWSIPFKKVKSLLSLEHGNVLFWLLLPMAALEQEEIWELKPMLEKQFQTLGFGKDTAAQAADSLIAGIIRHD